MITSPGCRHRPVTDDFDMNEGDGVSWVEGWMMITHRRIIFPLYFYFFFNFVNEMKNINFAQFLSSNIWRSIIVLYCFLP